MMRAFAILIVLMVGSVASAAEKLNVLFIAVDDLKPVLGCYGDAIAKTPNIDRLAGTGTVFLNAHCQWPVCGPTRASLMTSLRPEANGVMDLKTDVRAKNPDVLTLPQYFRQNGYTTAGVGKIYDPRCVDSKKDCDKPSWSVPFLIPRPKIRDDDKEGGKPVVGVPDCDDADLMDGQIAIRGISLMRKLARSEEPFFLAVGFKKPHLPFVAPKKYWDMYDRGAFPLAKHRGGIDNDSGYVLHDSPELRGYTGVPKEGTIPESLQRECLHGYYACVSFIDAQIGLVLDALKKQGLDKNTVIVLWGDHGFHLGDHGMWGKHSTLEQATRVPLIFAAPGEQFTRKSSSPVEFTDIFPTLCELAGIPVPNGLNGRSVVPILNGSQDKVREGALTVFKKSGCLGYSYRTDRYRYTEWVNKRGKTVAMDLFDYQTDPEETKNLASNKAHQPLIEKLAKQLRQDAAGCEQIKLLTRE